jgi:hypothetical protein
MLPQLNIWFLDKTWFLLTVCARRNQSIGLVSLFAQLSRQESLRILRYANYITSVDRRIVAIDHRDRQIAIITNLVRPPVDYGDIPCCCHFACRHQGWQPRHFLIGCGCDLRRGNYATCVEVGAPVYLADILDDLYDKILKLAESTARCKTKTRILPPSHLSFTVKKDEEPNKL